MAKPPKCPICLAHHWGVKHAFQTETKASPSSSSPKKTSAVRASKRLSLEVPKIASISGLSKDAVLAVLAAIKAAGGQIEWGDLVKRRARIARNVKRHRERKAHK